MRHEDVGKWALRNGKFIKISDKVTLRSFCFAPKKIQASGFYDRALGKNFKSKEEKYQYMDRHGFMEGGDFKDAPLDTKGEIANDVLEKELGIEFK